MHDDAVHLGPDELDLWLDGRLPAAQTSHLETCPACQQAAEETRDIVLQLSTLPRLAPERSFVDQVMARVEIPAAAPAHLTGDDLDLWIEGALPAVREAHLRGCAECQALADAERTLVLRLQQVPSSGFSTA